MAITGQQPMAMTEDRRLKWRRTTIAGQTAPHDFVGTFDGIVVARIHQVPFSFPNSGDWEYSMTHIGSGRFGFADRHNVSGTLRSKQDAADECTRLFFALYDEFKAHNMDWRNPRKQQALFTG